MLSYAKGGMLVLIKYFEKAYKNKIFIIIPVFVTIFAMMMTITSCRQGTDGNDNSSSGGMANHETANPATGSSKEPENNDSPGNIVNNNDSDDKNGTEGISDNTGNKNTTKQRLLNSASIDLDKDGINEQVRAVEAEARNDKGEKTGEKEGLLIISKKGDTLTVPFARKPASDFSELMSGIEFKDLDGDGIKDIFITIPGFGASFSYTYFYIYNYANGKSYSFTSDEELFRFAGDFGFEYKGNGKLLIKSEKYNVRSVFNVADSMGYSEDESVNRYYESSFVEPVPVDISAASRVMLAEDGGVVCIKIPLPVFGLATSDMIGEIDLYYTVDNNFKPRMSAAKIIDFDNGNLKEIGRIKF